MPAWPRRGWRLVCATALALVLVTWAGTAHAATYDVVTTADSPHPFPMDTTCTSQLLFHACTLRAAIQAANAQSTGAGGTQHVINLTVPGTYQLTITGQDEFGSAGDLDLNNTNVAIVNTSGGNVVIDGNNTDRVFDVGPLLAAQLTIANPQPGPQFTITHGLAGGLGGGGIYNQSGSTLTLANVQLSANTALGGSGGGLLNEGSATLRSSLVNGNQASEGGGIYNNHGSLTLTNVTISGNSAVNGGGGIGQDGNMVATNATIAFNSSNGSGQAITSFGLGTQLRNTIVHSNSPAANCSGPGISSQGNNLDSGFTCGFSVGLGDLIGVNPQLAPLALNTPGNTQTHALQPGSPAIDGVTNLVCLFPSTDQRGVSRPQGPRCDIGAFEWVPPCSPRPNVGVSVVPLQNSGGRLQVMLTTNTNAGTLSNGISQLSFGGSGNHLSANDLVDIGGQTRSGSFVILFNFAVPSATFTIHQANASLPTTVQLVVKDACGDWETFVGGGAGTFPVPDVGPAASSAGASSGPQPSAAAATAGTATAGTASSATGGATGGATGSATAGTDRTTIAAAGTTAAAGPGALAAAPVLAPARTSGGTAPAVSPPSSRPGGEALVARPALLPPARPLLPPPPPPAAMLPPLPLGAALAAPPVVPPDAGVPVIPEASTLVLVLGGLLGLGIVAQRRRR